MHKLDWIQNKIMNRLNLFHYINAQKIAGKKIVFTNGCFDILHKGHIDILSRAADEGDILIVGINSDDSVKRLKGAQRPINNENDRALQIASMLVVDAVCIFGEDTPLEIIKLFQPDVLVKGGDYAIETIVGATEVMHRGGKVVVAPFVEGYSTSNTLLKIQSL
jgi:rfaE bifunctional protein nucleotidyltransferase chain/domain